jgi:hypothetical protein
MAFYIDLLLSTSPAPAIMAHNTDLVLADSHRQLWEGSLARFRSFLGEEIRQKADGPHSRAAQGRSTLPRNGFASEMEMNPFPFPSQIHFHFPVYACQEMDFEMEMEMVRDPFPGRAWFPLHLRFCKPEVQDPSGNGFERTL